jgi:hypothetical protein
VGGRCPRDSSDHEESPSDQTTTSMKALEVSPHTLPLPLFFLLSLRITLAYQNWNIVMSFVFCIEFDFYSIDSYLFCFLSFFDWFLFQFHLSHIWFHFIFMSNLVFILLIAICFVFYPFFYYFFLKFHSSIFYWFWICLCDLYGFAFYEINYCLMTCVTSFED